MNFILLGMIGPWQIILVVVLVLILFGGRKIPELMKGIGLGMKEFKKATNKDGQELDKAEDKVTEEELQKQKMKEK